MRYLVLLEATQPDTPPPAAVMEGVMQLGVEAARAGAMLDNGGLVPSAAGARVTVAAGELSVTDGPFAEAKELISYVVYDVATKEEAIEWSVRFMRLHADNWPGWSGEAKVLKVMGPEDFAPPRS